MRGADELLLDASVHIRIYEAKKSIQIFYSLSLYPSLQLCACS